MELQTIEDNTITVEDFISECMKQDIKNEMIFEYLRTNHKG